MFGTFQDRKVTSAYIHQSVYRTILNTVGFFLTYTFNFISTLLFKTWHHKPLKDIFKSYVLQEFK